MSAILNVLSGTKNDIRGRKRYQGQKTISGAENDIRDISFLCPPVINLIFAQVCDKQLYQHERKLEKREIQHIFGDMHLNFSAAGNFSC